MTRRALANGRLIVAVVSATAFLITIALSDAPRLHEWLHHAYGPNHECAVTMIASGSYDHAAHVPLISAPAPAIRFSKVLAMTPQWVESPFLGASIFEHAPPLNS